RRPGWHRLAVRFGPDRTELIVDGNELAHGDRSPGPLAEVRLATQVQNGHGAPKDLAASADDLQLVRVVEPSGTLEAGPGQAERRLVGGDQLFGKVKAADPARVSAEVDGKAVALDWTGVSGLYFRRSPRPARSLDGLWGRLEWRASPSPDGRDGDELEGV